MKNWLMDCAYRVPLRWGVFVGAAAASLVIARITITWQAVRAARLNPVNTIRYE